MSEIMEEEGTAIAVNYWAVFIATLMDIVVYCIVIIGGNILIAGKPFRLLDILVISWIIMFCLPMWPLFVVKYYQIKVFSWGIKSKFKEMRWEEMTKVRRSKILPMRIYYSIDGGSKSKGIRAPSLSIVSHRDLYMTTVEKNAPQNNVFRSKLIDDKNS